MKKIVKKKIKIKERALYKYQAYALFATSLDSLFPVNIDREKTVENKLEERNDNSLCNIDIIFIDSCFIKQVAGTTVTLFLLTRSKKILMKVR